MSEHSSESHEASSHSARPTQTRTTAGERRPMGLVMQGGGALGAYAWGAVTRLCEAGYYPAIVTGVSIGAINAAAIAGARGGDIIASLARLWTAITLAELPFTPPHVQELMSAFGVNGFFRPRTDYLNLLSWTNFYDVSPMRSTLEEICDFKQINDPSHMRLAVTATNVANGSSKRFYNNETKITPDHIIASGSLPPGFPMMQLHGTSYWDGGLFDNTPLRPLIHLLTDEEAETLPIFVIDLFPDGTETLPENMLQVRGRMLELTYENRFWDDYGGPRGATEYAHMLELLNRDLPADSAARQKPAFTGLLQHRCLKNLKVIPTERVAMTGGMDFSAAGIQRRFQHGYTAVDRFLAAEAHHHGTPPDDHARSARPAA